MSKKTIPQIESRITQIKMDLMDIGPMRPGSLTLQYKSPKDQTGPYWQISYTRKMKSRTDYVREQLVPDTRKQIEEYKRFKALTDEWVELSIEMAKLKAKGGRSERSG